MGYLTTRWLHEAPEDDQTQNAPEGQAAEAPAEGEAPEQDAGEDDENFDIDTSLDGDDEENPESGEDDMGEGDDFGGGDDGGTEAPPTDEEGEANPSNTEIFTSLTAEEQQIKISELKKLYRELYSSVNDLIHRIDDMDLDEDIMEPMSRVSEVLHRLQDSIADYFQNLFEMRSYLENDVKYNEFLLVLKKTTTVVDDLAKTREKRIGKDSTNSEDKNSNI